MLKSSPPMIILESNVLTNTQSSQISLFPSVVLVSSLVSPVFFYIFARYVYIYIPLPKIHELDSSRTISPDMQIACRQKAREASINRYRDI